MTGDISDTGAGEALWRVAIPDGWNVHVPEKLCDPAISQLVSISAAVLSTGDLNCLTFENELKKVVKALVKLEGLLMRSMQTFTSNVDDPEYVCKLMVYSDSTYGQGKASRLLLPTGEVPFATAKSRKLSKWANDIAYTAVLPIEYAHIPGLRNDLADYLSHVSDVIVHKAREAR